MTGRDTDSDWPLGDRIRHAREAAALSSREAARIAGFSPTTWASIESGTRVKDGQREPSKPSASNVVAAANVVGMDVDEALRLAGYDPRAYNPAGPRGAGRPVTSERELAQRMSQLTDHQRAAVGAVIDAMLDPAGASEKRAAWVSELAEQSTVEMSPGDDEKGRAPDVPEARPAARKGC